MGTRLYLRALPARARLAFELALLRFVLPRHVTQRPLDELLENLSAAHRLPRVKLSTLERDIRRVEVLIERRTSVPQTCLYRSLARYAILKRAGHSARFVLGIRKSGVDGGGHAWVEVDEQPFSERESPEQYAVTFRYPLPSRSGKVEE